MILIQGGNCTILVNQNCNINTGDNCKIKFISNCKIETGNKSKIDFYYPYDSKFKIGKYTIIYYNPTVENIMNIISNEWFYIDNNYNTCYDNPIVDIKYRKQLKFK